MKRIDLFCKSQASTAIYHSMDHHHQPPPSVQLGGRTIDRHNPIIRDGRRAPCSSASNLPINPVPYHQIHNQTTTRTDTNADNKCGLKTEPNTSNENVASTKTTTTTTTKRNSFSFKSSRYISSSFSRSSSSSREQKRKSGASKLSDNVERIADIIARKSSAKRNNEFSNGTPQASSRYLLGDVKDLEGLSDDNYKNDHVVSLEPKAAKKDDVDAAGSCFGPPSKPSSHQVVVLRVSLHCKGCEGKVRKHLSRMEGVSSYNIDFASKKVTIVGDITPSGALESISKVKNAQFWPSAPAFGAALDPQADLLNVVAT